MIRTLALKTAVTRHKAASICQLRAAFLAPRTPNAVTTISATEEKRVQTELVKPVHPLPAMIRMPARRIPVTRFKAVCMCRLRDARLAQRTPNAVTTISATASKPVRTELVKPVRS